MGKHRQLPLLLLGLLLLLPGAGARAQPATQRIILKDGSYQIVTRYVVKGDRVRYISAERGGEWEELPTALVDWEATRRWNSSQTPGAPQAAQAQKTPGNENAADIDAEERRERADEQARMPVVAAGLRLPDESGVWALDTYRDRPELVHIDQSDGDLNRDTGHNILRAAINPLGSAKEPIRIRGSHARVQMHVNQPVLYVSLDVTADAAPDSAPESALPVDTHGASSVNDKNAYSSPQSHYAIVRVQQRRDLRVVGEMKISMLGKVANSEDVIATSAEVMPGGRWLKVTPKQPLGFGEYALIEMLSPQEVNLDVWDFGVNPTAPENPHARLPHVRGLQ